MTTEPDLATQQTVRQPVPPAVEHDPLAKVMMRPRTFFAALTVVALLLGLLLALLPVSVANANVTEPGYVSCGNTIGGVETGPLGEELGRPSPIVLATYVNTCESAIATRLAFSWPMFFAGALAIVWAGVVRRTPPASGIQRNEEHRHFRNADLHQRDTRSTTP
jgi:hypothetical protein